MNTEQMKKILEDEDIVSPMEDCTQLGIIINFGVSQQVCW